MKLLFDENLSPRLIDLPSDIYPGASRVHHCGSASADDSAVWEYAKQQGFTIVSKDSDFETRSVYSGAPPKIIWVRDSNYTSGEVESILRTAFAAIKKFIQEDQETCLILGRQRIG